MTTANSILSFPFSFVLDGLHLWHHFLWSKDPWICGEYFTTISTLYIFEMALFVAYTALAVAYIVCTYAGFRRLFSRFYRRATAAAFGERECDVIIKGSGCPFFLLLCLIWNADAAENLSVGRECVEGGVEDRGQVKLKHGAQEKQRPPAFLTSLHTTTATKNKTGQISSKIISQFQKCENTEMIKWAVAYLWVMRRGVKVCCLRWCAFVQSGTVSVQLHPWCGLGVFS